MPYCVPVDYLFMNFCETFWKSLDVENEKKQEREVLVSLSSLCQVLYFGDWWFHYDNSTYTNAKCVFPWCAFKIYLCYGWQTATVANVILNVPWWKEKQVLSSSQHEKQTNNSSFLIVKLPDKSDAKMFSEVVNYLKIVGRHFFRYTA